MKKRGLGKGLEALLGSDNLGMDKDQASVEVDINLLQANRYQPRRIFDETSLSELASSIKQYGIIQPIAVRPIDHDRYEIIAGERRFRAAKLVGIKSVPIVIHDIDDKDCATFALIENIQREDLNVIDKALAIKKLLKEFDLTHQQASDVLNQSRSSISNLLRLLDLSDNVQQALIQKKIDMGHARALASFSKEQQKEFLVKIIDKNLTVREVERLVQATKQNPIKARAQKPSWLIEHEKRLEAHLKSKVRIEQKPTGKGKLVVYWDKKEDLDSILNSFDIDK